MGIDYDGVGGIGIKVDDEVMDKLIENKKFTEDEWDDDPYDCLENLGFQYAFAGSEYDGNVYPYLLVGGNTLGDINKNAPEFVSKLGEMGVDISTEDLRVISDYYIY